MTRFAKGKIEAFVGPPGLGASDDLEEVIDDNNQATLEICSAEANRLVVALPTDLISGSTYTLTVATQTGLCDQDVQVLQGDPGVYRSREKCRSCTSEVCRHACPTPPLRSPIITVSMSTRWSCCARCR